MDCTWPSRNCQKHLLPQSPREKVGSNDMVHNYYQEKAKKIAQLRKIKKNWQASMSSRVSNKDVHLGEHRKQKPFLKFNDLQCPTCKKCLYSANHDECVLEYLSRLNPRASAQNKDAKSHKTTKRYMPVEKSSASKKPERQISTGHSSGLVLHQMTSDHNRSELGIQDHSNEPSSSKLVPKVVPLAVKTATSRQELELLFHLHIAMLRTTVMITDGPRDHPLELVQWKSILCQLIQDGQLAIDPEMCMFALTVSIVEPKNIKEAMANSAWIEAMQDKLHQKRVLVEFHLLQLRDLEAGSDFLCPLQHKVLSHISDGLENEHFLMSSLEGGGFMLLQPDELQEPGLSDADHAEIGLVILGTSTLEGTSSIGDKLVSWMSKEKNSTTMSLAEAVTEYQLADMFTKALPEDQFKYLVRRIGMRCLTPADLEVVRLGINPMIQPEPEDLPKDNPKLEIAVLSFKICEKISSMGSKIMASCEDCLDGEGEVKVESMGGGVVIGVGQGEVKGSGVDFGVVNRVLGEILGEVMGEME
ncbi:hypothetical protein Tco_1264858 [Tanacetum coccineum]